MARSVLRAGQNPSLWPAVSTRCARTSASLGYYLLALLLEGVALYFFVASVSYWVEMNRAVAAG